MKFLGNQEAIPYLCPILVWHRDTSDILHLVNQTPIEWYCKKQATVATATYFSEFIAVQSMTHQIIDILYTGSTTGLSFLHIQG